jgi:hypothetical protein
MTPHRFRESLPEIKVGEESGVFAGNGVTALPNRLLEYGEFR